MVGLFTYTSIDVSRFYCIITRLCCLMAKQSNTGVIHSAVKLFKLDKMYRNRFKVNTINSVIESSAKCRGEKLLESHKW